MRDLLALSRLAKPQEILTKLRLSISRADDSHRRSRGDGRGGHAGIACGAATVARFGEVLATRQRELNLPEGFLSVLLDEDG